MFTHTIKIKAEDDKLVCDNILGAIYKVNANSHEWMCYRYQIALNFSVVYKDFWRGDIYLCKSGKLGFYHWLVKRWVKHCSSMSTLKPRCIFLLHRIGFGYTKIGESGKWANVFRHKDNSYGFIPTLKKIKQFQGENPNSFFDVMVSDHLMPGIQRSPKRFFFPRPFPPSIKFSVDTTELNLAMNLIQESVKALKGVAGTKTQKE